MTIERERSAALPSVKDAFEQELFDAIRAVKLPAPARELHFMWCCEHPKRRHVTERVIGAFDWEDRDYCADCELDVCEHAFSKDRDWRFDLAWPLDMLACEVDGGTFSGGRHTRGQGYENDCEKLNEAVLRGWQVLRVTSKQVESGEALEWIERAFGRTGRT